MLNINDLNKIYRKILRSHINERSNPPAMLGRME